MPELANETPREPCRHSEKHFDLRRSGGSGVTWICAACAHQGRLTRSESEAFMDGWWWALNRAETEIDRLRAG